MTPRMRFFAALGLYAAWLVALAGLAISSGIAPRSTTAASPAPAASEGTVPR